MPHAPLGRLSSRQRRAWRERRRVIWWGKHVGAILLELLCGGAQRSWISRHRRCGAHGSVGTPITSWHAARSCVCFFGASRRILCRALEMKTCIVRCSSASGGEPGTAGAAPDILLPADARRCSRLAPPRSRVRYTCNFVALSLCWRVRGMHRSEAPGLPWQSRAPAPG